MNRVKIVKFREPYINETEGLKVRRGMIQVSFYISY